jgi:hypothetical protein
LIKSNALWDFIFGHLSSAQMENHFLTMSSVRGVEKKSMWDLSFHNADYQSREEK